MKTDHETEVSEARKRVHHMDAVDGYRERQPLTILLALEAGLRHPESKAAYDALIMLRELCGVEK